MRRRSAWKGGSEPPSDGASGSVNACVREGQSRRHGTGMLYRLRCTEVRVKV